MSASLIDHHRQPCRIKLYTYPDHHKLLHELLAAATPILSKNASCLHSDMEWACQEDNFVSHNGRLWTAELPIFERLLSACGRTDSPHEADAFLVPLFFGMLSSFGWGLFNGGGGTMRGLKHKFSQEATKLFARPPHLTEENAARHIYLATVDVEFVEARWFVKNGSRPIVVHLGDDHQAANPLPGKCAGQTARCSEAQIEQWKKKLLLRNDLTVPYRLSSWLPMGFPPPYVERKSLLLFGNVNLARHPSRRRLDEEIRMEAGRLGLSSRLLLTPTMTSVGEAARHSLDARFCLCPTGDSKGFTGRFYFSILHDCIPVRVDGWHRNLSVEELALPFRHRIDWSRAMVNYNPSRRGVEGEGDGESLLATLHGMSNREVEARTRYLREIAPRLVYDRNAPVDAADLVVEQVEARVRAIARL